MNKPIEIVINNSGSHDAFVSILRDVRTSVIPSIEVTLNPGKADLEKMLEDPIVILRTIIECSVPISTRMDYPSGGRPIVFFNRSGHNRLKLLKQDAYAITQLIGYSDQKAIIHGPDFIQVFSPSNSELTISLFDEECFDQSLPQFIKLYGSHYGPRMFRKNDPEEKILD